MGLTTWLTESFFPFLLAILPGGLWFAFWLFAVDWRRVWPVLAEGGWAPCVLLGLVAATAWSRINPGVCDCLGFVIVPNFWWQLGSVAALAAVALFAGWLQGQMQFEPPEVPVGPPPVSPADQPIGHDEVHQLGDHHGYDHGHH
jgi:hypothetical protein